MARKAETERTEIWMTEEAERVAATMEVEITEVWKEVREMKKIEEAEETEEEEEEEEEQVWGPPFLQPSRWRG